jgi:CRP/FNR family transcriptional regulator
MTLPEGVACECRTKECLLCPAMLLSGASAEQVCEIAGLRNRQYLDPHMFLFRAGEPSGRMYVLRAGLVKLTKSLPDGREQIIGLRKAGNVVGLEAMVSDVHQYSVQALSPVIACSVAYRDMMRIVEQNPVVSLHAIRLLTQELEKAQILIGELGMKSAPERVAALISSLASDEGASPVKLTIPLSRQEIADLLGMSLETVSRVIAHYVRQGLIRAPRGGHDWLILDYPRLRRLAGPAVSTDGGAAGSPGPLL